MGLLADRINFTMIATKAQDEHTWNNMVELVSNGTYKLGYTGFSQTYSRGLLVDFSLPFVSSSLRLFYKVNC